MIDAFEYGMTVTLPVPVPEAESRVRAALADEGFGVLSEIDVESTLREKLGVETGPYRILGACNPPLAHRALSADPDIGLLLPCNVIVYQGESSAESIVSAIDPVAQLGVTAREEIAGVAEAVKVKMERVLRSLA